MSILILAEHDNLVLKPATQHTITAGSKISEKGGNPEVHVLVIGENAQGVAQASARRGRQWRALKLKLRPSNHVPLNAVT